MNATVDLRSDTVTRPDAAMRRAMAEAEVGDDVYREDPTVRRLEEEAAHALGFEAALFVPSGTMGNQIALRLHAGRGTEVLCEARAHVLDYEMAAMAALSGLQPRVVSSRDGLPDPATLEAAIRDTLAYRARTGVVTLENTHNMAGGRAFGRDRIDPLLRVAHGRGLPVHLDGARIFNAAVALGVPAAELARGFDSVMFCLSKGLGAPVGSLLCGPRDFIAESWRVRKMLGGGMRQSGVLAAAGLLALSDGPGRLAADHTRARRLADALAVLPGVVLDPATVETNILIFELTETAISGAEPHPSARFVARAAEKGLSCGTITESSVRFVTHRDLDDTAIDRAIAIVEEIAEESTR